MNFTSNIHTTIKAHLRYTHTHTLKYADEIVTAFHLE